MWQLVNHTPYAAERSFVRDLDGAEIWLIAVKCTYALGGDGSTSLLEEQAPVFLAPRYRGEPSNSSLLYDSDMLYPRVATDILLHGSAWAPGGRPVAQLDVGLAVGEWRKVLRVFGARTWERYSNGPRLSAPEPFARMPITYENAFGGKAPEDGHEERRNPVGRGFARSAESLIGQSAPNIEHPSTPLSHWQDKPPPAGFGPIAQTWAPRLGFAGTYDDRWKQERAPLRPENFDARFNQTAPLDQQAFGFLRGGEPVVLTNLSQVSELRLTLPRVWLAFRTDFGAERVDHRASLHTLILEPDELRLTMVWGTHLRCHNKEHLLKRTHIWQKDSI